MASPSESRPVALITGLTGFTGRYVARALEQQGYAVHGWTHHADADGEAESVDLLDREAVLDAARRLSPDVVVHLAAIAFVAHGDADAIYRVNVVGTRNLLEALASLERKPRRVLLVSSANIYGNIGGMISEDAPASPQNDYAVSKLAMEYMARLWSEQLSITVVRPFNYTGVGQSDKFLLPKIVSHFRRKAEVIELGNLDVSRDFNDVRNVAEVYSRLLAADAASDVFNVCSGQEHSLREVIAMMEDISGHRLEVRVNPAFVRTNEVKRLLGNASKLAASVGGLPGFSLRETLQWMYEQDI